jgi:inner membrane protein
MSMQTASDLLKAACDRLQASLLVRVLATAFLVLLLQIPIGLINGAVEERRATRSEAMESVTRTSGGAQTVLGPVLVVPTLTRTTDADGKPREVRTLRHLLPRTLEVQTRAETEIRRRGIFDVPLFVATTEIRGSFAPAELEPTASNPRTLLWEEAQLCLGLGDVRAIREAPPARFGAASVTFQPGPGRCGFIRNGIHAPLIDERLPAGGGSEVPFSIRLVLAGSGRLAFVPVGSETQLRASGNWTTPSFDGAFLPREREVRDDGFTASWRVLHLARNFPVVFDEGDVSAERFASSDFGVSFLSAVDAYRSTDRALKYQLLFLALTATVFFMFELLAGRRVHPIQYLLVGLALCLFYLLLLSLAEHVGFTAAYWVAAGSITSLVGIYGSFVLGRRLRGLVLAAVLATLYEFLFVLLQLQDYALLAGSLGLLVALTAIMLLTRRVNWYAPIAPAAASTPARSTE